MATKKKAVGRAKKKNVVKKKKAPAKKPSTTKKAGTAKKRKKPSGPGARKSPSKKKPGSALKRAEEGLYQHERILSNSTDMIALLDENFVYVTANSSYAEAFEKTPNQIIGRSVSEVFGRKFFEEVIEPNARRCLQGESINYQAWFDFPAFESRYMEINYFPYVGPDKKIKGFVVNGRDITERKRAEETLRMMEKAIENTHTGITITDVEGRIIYSNPAEAKMHGYVREEMIGKESDFLAPPELSQRSTVEQMKGMGSWSRESINVHKDGSRFPVFLRSDVVLDQNGEPTAVVTTSEDITERKRAAEALRKAHDGLEETVQERTVELIKTNKDLKAQIEKRKKAEEKLIVIQNRLHFLLATGPAVIYTGEASVNYATTLISENVRQQTGYEPNEFIDDPVFWANHIHPEERERILAGVSDVFKNDYYEHEYRFLHKDGEYHWMHDKIRLVRDSEGNPVEIIGSWMDITDRKILEVQVLRQSKELEKSHNELEKRVEERTAELTAANKALKKEIVDRKRAEEALREREILLQTTQKIGRIGSWAMDLSTNEVKWSDQLYDLFGIENDGEALDYEKVLSAIHPEDREMAIKVSSEAATAGRAYELEHRVLLPDGTIRRLLVVGDVIRDEKGEAVEIGGTTRDVTAQRGAEEALRERTHDLDKRVKELDCLYSISKIIESYLPLDEALRKIVECIPTGWQYPEIACARIEVDGLSVRTSNFKQTDWLLAADIMAGDRKAGRMEVFYLEPKEQLFEGPFIKEERSLIDDIAERLGRIIEHRKAEDELRLKSEILMNMSEGIYLVRSSDFKIVYANPKFEQMFDYDPGEIIGKDVSIVNAPASERSAVETRDSIMEVLEEAGEWHGEVNNIKKDGTTFWCYANVSVFDHPEYGISLVSVHEDITDRKRLEEELQKTQKLESVGVLAGGIAHDFNNILQALWGNIQLIQMQIEPKSETAQLTIEAEKACKRARDLTQQLLTFSRGGAPVKKMAALEDIIMECCDFSVRGSNVVCRYSISDDLWPVEIDVGQISQVLNNLVVNADQAMPDGGNVNVSADNFVLDIEEDTHNLPLGPGNYIKISIEDQGTGIGEESLSKIFDPYFTTKQKGSGLGLAICYSIIKNHDGYLGVTSETGKGTTFEIYLPASRASVLPEEKEEEKLLTGQGRVLLMDDDQQLKKLAGRALEQLGYEVDFASDGQEAIEMYVKAMKSQRPYSVVILDLTVPGGMGGKEAIAKLRKIDAEVKAIVSSGYSNDPVLADFSEYGFGAILAKPYAIKELAEVLHDVVGVKETGQ